MRRQAGYQLLEAEAWKGRLREATDFDGAVREASETVALMKSVECDVSKAADQQRVLEFIISTGEVDRDFDRVNPKGWDLKAYRKNPVILWAHDSRMPPIGRSLKVSLEDEKLVARAEFMPAELNPFADAVFQMLAQRWMRTASVGFRPTQVNPAEEEERRNRYGLDFVKQELLEWSVVPIPANSSALMRAHEAGINTRPIKAWAEMVLDLREPLPGLGLNDIEAAWKAIKGPEKLVVWVESDELSKAPADPADVPRDPPGAPPEGEIELTSGEIITFRRRPTGEYDVLRSGDPVLVVEDPDLVEWDEDGVLRMATPEASELVEFEIDDEPADDDEALALEVETPEEKSAPDLDPAELGQAIAKLLGEQIQQALARA